MIGYIENKSIVNICKETIEYGESYTRNKRVCNGITDNDFLLQGICRVITVNRSGRDFMQKFADTNLFKIEELNKALKIPRSTYFTALSSERRGSYISETCDGIYRILNNYCTNNNIDYLSDFEELKGRSIMSGDGHYIKHAVHTKKINDKYPQLGIIYIQNLRNGLSIPMCSVENDTSNKPHEFPFLKNKLAEFSDKLDLKDPLLVYDPACINKTFWTVIERQRTNGFHIITRTKKNMVFTFKEDLDFDKSDPINIGVKKYSIVGFNNAGTMYYVKYVDPETKKVYTFLTTDKTLRPGVVAYIYKIRWKIEKVYDVFKNKLFEQKAWGKTAVAHKSQSSILAATYNIIRFLTELLDSQFGIREEKLIKKRDKALEKRALNANKKGNKINILEIVLPYMFQISQQFIRLIRNIIFECSFLKAEFSKFKKRMETY